jgi:hypothetical protein
MNTANLLWFVTNILQKQHAKFQLQVSEIVFASIKGREPLSTTPDSFLAKNSHSGGRSNWIGRGVHRRLVEDNDKSTLHKFLLE